MFTKHDLRKMLYGYVWFLEVYVAMNWTTYNNALLSFIVAIIVNVLVMWNWEHRKSLVGRRPYNHANK